MSEALTMQAPVAENVAMQDSIDHVQQLGRLTVLEKLTVDVADLEPSPMLDITRNPTKPWTGDPKTGHWDSDEITDL